MGKKIDEKDYIILINLIGLIKILNI